MSEQLKSMNAYANVLVFGDLSFSDLLKDCSLAINMAYDDDGNYALEIRHRLLQVALIIGASAEATRRGMSEN